MIGARRSVHPRVCGEHSCIPPTNPSSIGSSPRVRGTRLRQPRFAENVRFIPACAGNTESPIPGSWRAPVHPRVCGEHRRSRTLSKPPGGSSPRVRGTHRSGCLRRRRSRFIPACAGNTRTSPPSRARPTVHPRVCGEHPKAQSSRESRDGSSPRVRGTRRRSGCWRCRSTVHPRVCGEHSRVRGDAHAGDGSSPRVRGTRGVDEIGTVLDRFIPACAGNTAPISTIPERWTVHPRVCGEHIGGRNGAAKQFGSSPRVRGTQPPEAPRRRSARFIPACAGNTERSRRRPRSPPVHPRVCGEHRLNRPSGCVKSGSSPRVRGTRTDGHGGTGRVRFIPACAGNTLEGVFGKHFLPVHPRVCGEHQVFRSSLQASAGSSPRVRGTQDRHHDDRGTGRFIPACAGNTWSSRPETRYGSVHPRVCGEHLMRCQRSTPLNGSSPRVRGTRRRGVSGRAAARFIPACAGNTTDATVSKLEDDGSSPRVRGTPARRRRFQLVRRFIPACAGNTRRRRREAPGLSVHPRVCGEHLNCAFHTSTVCGSSPRVRGTRALLAQGFSRHRFIPACAGNTWGGRAGPSRFPVHPRVCGEHQLSIIAAVGVPGSSPRVRGTPRRSKAHADVVRFIPACAGNTLRAAHRADIRPVHPRVCGEHEVRYYPKRGGAGSSPRVRGTRTRRADHDPARRFIPACAGNTLRTR